MSVESAMWLFGLAGATAFAALLGEFYAAGLVFCGLLTITGAVLMASAK